MFYLRLYFYRYKLITLCFNSPDVADKEDTADVKSEEVKKGDKGEGSQATSLLT
jgi:hypothetical protein